jgi:predicted metal-binding membrane protein
VEAARLPRGGSAGRFERAQIALLGVLLVLAGISWLVTDERMGGMASAPGMDLGSLGFYTTVWVVMMAAMMFPSVAPTVLTYERLREGHRAKGKGAAPTPRPSSSPAT